MKKQIKLMLLIFFALLLFTQNVFAKGKIQMFLEKETVLPGEEFLVNIEITGTQVAAFSLEIYWDKNMLAYKNGPENSNCVDNTIVYTWVAEDGKNKEKIEIESFYWEAIQEGKTNIVVTGEFFNENGDKIKIDAKSFSVQIGEEKEEIEQIKDVEENTEKNNAKLQILRLNQEGISPDFDKSIKEYYFITGEETERLEVTAIPENKNASVQITGNDNLKIGRNKIEITVTSQDESQVLQYVIYVTKTNNPNLANANLENLAIRQSDLNPEFEANNTQYKAEISNETSEIELLAIPEDQKAKVQINGSKIMQEGENKIEINVIAQDGITNKKYEISIYKRSLEEELEKGEEEKIQAEKLSDILEKQQEEINNHNNQEVVENNSSENIEKNKQKSFAIGFVFFLFCIILGIYIYKNTSKKWKKQKNKN